MTVLLTTSTHDRHSGRSANADRRVLVVWCPDWPVISAVASLGLVPSSPIAVIDRGEVYACSQAARLDGVRRGMRRRDASARCPELTVVDHSLERDVRAFESILSTIEDTTSAVTPIRPGLCALSVPSRYYGGEREAAAVIAEHLVTAGVWECRIGIADGIFTAEQAARQAAPGPLRDSGRRLREVPGRPADHGSGRPRVGELLRRLGIRTLGDFAALPARDVLTRFGSQGALIHRLARGSDSDRRRPPATS